jgi:hypothetical protein
MIAIQFIFGSLIRYNEPDPTGHVLCALESIPDFKQHPCCLTYFLATTQKSKQRKPSRLKFLTAYNGLFYGRQPRCRYECIPSNSTQMTSPRGVRCHLPQE